MLLLPTYGGVPPGRVVAFAPRYARSQPHFAVTAASAWHLRAHLVRLFIGFMETRTWYEGQCSGQRHGAARHRKRRQRCPRPLRRSSFSASSHWRLPALSRKKKLSSLSPSWKNPCRASSDELTGRALAPVRPSIQYAGRTRGCPGAGFSFLAGLERPAGAGR